ncbi:MAG: type IX secretion system sortase PorU [Candidatus Marinimicrobia bacterium]|nr:type IX secretion system sortase PorU [Candidatus Neomarinimicrobiota bacterium]MCF7829613.1 type IX secretion system sortase PorU [Candidatus Neomarinimicrobiota bacterium]MCF7879773.1 type IX secretion system sortase PorU [Candidatus Neomarinimicrobiota bacterium]
MDYQVDFQWTEYTETIDGSEYSLWGNGSISDNVNVDGRLTPVVGFRVPIQPDVTPQIEIINKQTVRRESGPLPPASEAGHGYNSSSEVVFIGHQSFRGYNMGQFLLIPVRPNGDQVELLTSATIRISWTGGNTSPLTEELSRFDTMALRTQETTKSASLFRRDQSQSLTKQTVQAQTDRSGTWYKIPVTSTGMHRISYSWLQRNEVPVENIDIDLIRMFAAPNFGLPLETPRGPSIAEIGPMLREIPVRITQESASTEFKQGDAIEFYGQPPSRFVPDGENVRFVRNSFETTNYYWLNLPGEKSTEPGKRLTTSNVSSSDNSITTAQGVYRYEEERRNFFGSGLRWYGNSFFGAYDKQAFPLDIPNIVTDSSANIQIAVARGNDANRHFWEFSINESPIGDASIRSGEYSSAVASLSENVSGDLFSSTGNSIEIISNGETSSAQGHLDYIQLKYIQQLSFPENKDIYSFFTRPRSGSQTYQVSGVSPNNLLVLDVTDPDEMTNLATASDPNGIRFTVEFDQSVNVREIVLIQTGQRTQPESITEVESFSEPTLRRDDLMADYIIITAEPFLEEAERLAEFRSTFSSPTDEPLSVEIATVEQIYNEFSGGLQDPVALRNFLSWAYRQWRGEEPAQYALLFGDGDYDYRNITGSSQIFVPTWQFESTREVDTKEIDDRFVLVDGRDNLPDMAIGRLTATTVDEARHMVDKIIQYETSPPFGQWRLNLTMVGDDTQRPESKGNYQLAHIQKLEDSVLRKIPDIFHLRKIYLPDFPIVQDLSSFGVTRPATTDALLDQLRQGTLVVNFSGHGSPKVWTQERILTMERDLNRIETGGKLPLWVAATCEWGRFDMVGDVSMTEGLLAQESNGAIGILSAARLSYLTPNINFMGRFFGTLFSDSQHPSNSLPVGLAAMMSKTTNLNDERYVFFGDPALRLASPTYSAELTDVTPDTFAALSKIDYNGKVQMADSAISAGFSGTGVLSVFDSKTSVQHSYPTYYPNDTTYEYLNYSLSGSRIFYGPVSITGGDFTGEFIVPKDIRYSGDTGKMVMLYQGADSVVTGAGQRRSIVFQGTATGIEDAQGPSIQIGFEGYEFQSGDVIPSDAVLDIAVFDEYGINITGSVGHQLKLELNGPTTTEYNLTEFFSYNENSYQEGHVVYPLSNVEPGEYTLTVRAWDSSNNLSVQSADVTFIEGGDFTVTQAYNYPNPMQNETDFTFSISSPGSVKLTIYTLSGQAIRTLERTFGIAGFHSIHWNGRDRYGAPIANGMYLYRISATSSESNDTDHFVGKLAVTR